jgi:hypothetical protein
MMHDAKDMLCAKEQPGGESVTSSSGGDRERVQSAERDQDLRPCGYHFVFCFDAETEKEHFLGSLSGTGYRYQDPLDPTLVGQAHSQAMRSECHET